MEQFGSKLFNQSGKITLLFRFPETKKVLNIYYIYEIIRTTKKGEDASMLFTQVLEEYKIYLKGIDKSKRTVEGYFQDLNFFQKWLQQKYNCPAYLDDITFEDVEEFLRILKDERNYKPASRKRVAASIKMLYRFTYKKKLSTEDIASQMEPIKVPQKEREYLKEEEVMSFVEAVEHKLAKVTIQTMFYAGLRVSECINLKVEEIDMEQKMLKVVEGKGGKNRTIPICQKLLEIFEDYNTWRVESDYFFATEKSGRFSKVRLEAIIRDTRKKLNLKKNVTAHTFRHSFASRLVAKNVNIVNISKLLGHSDIKVTSIYTHTDISQLQDAVNLM